MRAMLFVVAMFLPLSVFGQSEFIGRWRIEAFVQSETRVPNAGGGHCEHDFYPNGETLPEKITFRGVVKKSPILLKASSRLFSPTRVKVINSRAYQYAYRTDLMWWVYTISKVRFGRVSNGVADVQITRELWQKFSTNGPWYKTCIALYLGDAEK